MSLIQDSTRSDYMVKIANCKKPLHWKSPTFLFSNYKKLGRILRQNFSLSHLQSRTIFAWINYNNAGSNMIAGILWSEEHSVILTTSPTFLSFSCIRYFIPQHSEASSCVFFWQFHWTTYLLQAHSASPCIPHMGVQIPFSEQWYLETKIWHEGTHSYCPFQWTESELF